MDEIEKKLSDAKNSPHWSKPTKEITVESQSKKKLITDNIRDAINNPDMMDETPKLINAIIHQNVFGKIDISITCSYDKIECSVSREMVEAGSTFLMKFYNWLEPIKQKRWIKLWASAGGLVSYFGFMIALVISGPLSSQLLGEPSTAKIVNRAIDKQAEELLEGGIEQDEVRKAIELLLKRNTNYIPADIQIIPTPFYQKPVFKKVCAWNVAFAIILAIIAISPKSNIGIGQGNRKVRFWKKWIQINIYSIPSLIFTAILFPKIASFF